MIIAQQPSTLVDIIYKQKAEGLTIGFVPTMGALHQGHTELVNLAASQTGAAVCSIFVNPTQFNDPSDFQKYPNRLEADIRLLSKTDCRVLFRPSASIIYPAGSSTLEQYDLGQLDRILEGEHRPGHFQGVCQVMKRLLDTVRPDFLFMGQKDYQQCMVVNRLLTYLDYKVTLITCPTVREKDGLAMSSRNLRLTAEQRSLAPEIFKTLQFVSDNIQPGTLSALLGTASDRLETAGFKVDYLEVAEQSTLHIVRDWDGTMKLVVLVAAFLGEVRLIDNLIIS